MVLPISWDLVRNAGSQCLPPTAPALPSPPNHWVQVCLVTGSPGDPCAQRRLRTLDTTSDVVVRKTSLAEVGAF